jgi:preprotein translocase subunit SecD
MIHNRFRTLLLAGLAGIFAACAPGPHETRYRNLELRLVSEKGGQEFRLWMEKGTLALDPEVQFSGKDFAAIETAHGGDDKKTPSLNLNFTPEASARFTTLTTERTGRRLAIVIDGMVVTAPKILHPITTGRFEITGASEADVHEMYRHIVGHVL